MSEGPGWHGVPDTMAEMWDRLTEMSNKRMIGEGLKLLDAARGLLAETSPRPCCLQFDRAVDGVVRCMACGRPKQI